MKRIKNKILSLILTLSALISATLVPVFAATSYVPASISGSTLSTNPNGIISTIINFLFIIVGLIFFVILVIAGIQWVTAGGEEKGKEEAQKRIINAIIGVAIVAGSYLIVEIVSGLLGIGGIFGNNLFSHNCGTTTNSSGSSVCLNGTLGN